MQCRKMHAAKCTSMHCMEEHAVHSIVPLPPLPPCPTSAKLCPQAGPGHMQALLRYHAVHGGHPVAR